MGEETYGSGGGIEYEVTRLTGKKPVDAMREKTADAKSSTSYSGVVGLKEKRLDS